MRGLLLSFAIGFVAFANGAPTDEESKVYSKSFNYGNKDVIYPALPFWKNDLLYAVCEGSDAVTKKCKVYLESSNVEERSVQSCDLDLKFTGPSGHNVGLFNTGHSKAVIAIPDRVAQQFTLIIVNLKGCQIKEVTIDVTGLSEDPNKTPSLMVVPREKNFDVLFHHRRCYEYHCTVTFTYEGEEYNSVARFSIKNLNFLRVESINSSLLVYGIDEESAKVCLVHDHENESDTLFMDKVTPVALSTEENKLGYCKYAPQKLVCKQYDADGKTKIMEAEVKIGEEQLQFIDMHNLEKGLLVLSAEYDAVRKTRNVFIVRVDEQGKQGKYVNVDLKCNGASDFLYPKLYKNSHGQYCVTSYCIAPQGSSNFSHNTRCFFKTELF